MEDEKYKISGTLTFKPKERITAFVLEMGGFLPLCFTGAKIILVDRNILSNALNITNNGKHKDNVANEWWFSFLDYPNYHLNPILSALEGSCRKIQTYELFCLEFKRGREILQRAFPNATVVDYSEIHYKAAYDLVKEIIHDYNSEVNFLKEAVPLVVQRNPRDKLYKIESKIIQSLLNNGLNNSTLSLIACLSCLYESAGSGSKSIGRQVLKPKKIYTDPMAHNALMDLYSLIFLIQSNTKLVENIGLCTSDNGLLRFWCALKADKDGVTSPTGFKFSITLTSEMFESLNDEEISALMNRIGITKS